MKKIKWLLAVQRNGEQIYNEITTLHPSRWLQKKNGTSDTYDEEEGKPDFYTVTFALKMTK